MAEPGQPAESQALVQALQERVCALEAELQQFRNWSTLERRYRALAEELALAVWDSDDKGFCSEAWDWWEHFTGQSRTEGAGWGWLECVHPDDRHSAREQWHRALDQRATYESEFRVRNRNGSWRYLSARGIPIVGNSGETLEWIGTFTDVTAYHEARIALAQSERRFRSIFDLAAVGIVEASFPGGKFSAVNPKMEEITGYTAAELSEMTFADLTHPEDLPESVDAMSSLLRGTTTSEILEKRYIHRAGHTVWVRVHVTLLRDPAGATINSVAVIEDITASKAAEEAARRSTEKLQLVADSVPALIGYIDRDLRYQFANRTYEEWFSVQRTEVEGHSVSEVLGERMFETLQPLLRKALGGEKAVYEGWAPYRSGARYVRTVYLPDFAADGNVQGLAVLVQDLTREHDVAEHVERLNQELQSRVREFQTLFNAMPAAVAIAHDPAGEDIRVNRAFAAILGVPPESNASAAQPQRPFRFLRDGRDVAPEDLPQQRAQRLRRTIEGEELEVLRADGRRFHLYGSVVPLLDDQNRVQGSVAAYLDVTARKEMEEALRRSERRLSLLVEASPVGILLANLQGDIHYANQAFLRIVGYTALEAAVTPLRWSELTPPEWRHMDQQAEEELLRGGFVTPFEKEYIRKDGSRVPVLLGGCLMDEPYADREQIVAFVVDLTERKKVETDLRNANVELRRANHDLEEFAYAAAHDLQEPLRMVSLFTQLLERRHKGEFQGSAAEIMQQIIESASRAQTLVSDLLAYTRVIHAHPETPLTVDCNEVLAQVLNDLGVAVAETGATVTFDPLPAVSMSRSHLGQLFQNLIGNALKYAQPGLPPSVHISVRAIESAYLFTVRDNGIGVAREYQDRIFGVFKRLHGQNVPGTGIGLAICRRIVERYGGHLWVESAGEGFGSTFLFTVPT